MHSSPAAHARLAAGAGPAFMGLHFAEPVAPRYVRIEVVGPDGSRLNRGPVRATRSGGVGVHVADGPDGSYRVGWRVVSRDGHVASGTFGFTVGRPGAAPAPKIDAAALEQLPQATSVTFAAARGLQYAALALAFGTMLFGLVVWRGPAATLRRLLLAGVVLGAASAAVALASEAATVAGTTPWSSAVPGVIWDSLSGLSNATCVWALVLAGWLAALAAWLRRPGGVAAIVLIDALVVSPAFCGHAAGSALAPAVALHVLAMSAWLGGLVALLVVWRSASPRELAVTVDRFSRMALPAACVVFATGALQVLTRVEPGQLLDSGYGRLVLAKLLLFSALLALAARNRLRLDATRALRAAVGAEVAIAAVVLAATGVLAGAAPPS